VRVLHNVFNDRLIFAAGDNAENSMISRDANGSAAVNGVNDRRNFRYITVGPLPCDLPKNPVNVRKNNSRQEPTRYNLSPIYSVILTRDYRVERCIYIFSD